MDLVVKRPRPRERSAPVLRGSILVTQFKREGSTAGGATGRATKIQRVWPSGLPPGFSLHARTTVRADDWRGKQQLVRYILRPPVALERLHFLPDELVRIELKQVRSFSDRGTTSARSWRDVWCRCSS